MNIATKAYLFRELALTVDRTKLEGGRDFGRYKEFIDQWADSYQMYGELFESKWNVILLLNDQNRKQKHIMHAGRVDEAGTHQQLMSQKGRYFALYQSQFGES